MLSGVTLYRGGAICQLTECAAIGTPQCLADFLQFMGPPLMFSFTIRAIDLLEQRVSFPHQVSVLRVCFEF